CYGFRRKPWLKVETIDSHIKAVTDLWKQQQLAGLNSHPSPRSGFLVKAYRQAVIKSKAKQSAASYEGKATHSLADGYDEIEHAAISTRYLRRAATDKAKTSDQHDSLRARLNFFLSSAIMARSENTRHAKLSDLYSHKLPNSAPHPSQALVITFLTSKAKTGEHKERGVAIRHKDVGVCSLVALAMYLFFRFQTCDGEALDFDTRRDLYDTTTVASSSPPRSNDRSDLGHANRTPQQVLFRAWRELLEPQSSLMQCEDVGGDYWISRSLLKPPQHPTRQIFPWIEAQEITIEAGTGSDRDAAALEFFRLLKHLRVVLLQDVAVL
ncbi:unnamed protein product, partial [Tilletia laevis]